MTFLLVNRVRETCISPGTGTAVLAGAALGYQTFSAGVGANNTTYYVIADQSGANWEVGYGTVGALGTTLARTTVLSSSNGGSLVNFTSGTQDVWVDYPANKAVFQDSTGTVSVPVLLTTSTTSTTPNLSFNASNTGFSAGASISGNYLQSLLQNKSGTAGASTNYVLSNDLGTDSTYYGEFGMNSSVFSASTPSDFFSINNGIYFSGHDGDISVGSGNGFKTYLTWGSSGQSAHVINASGALGFSTNLGTTPALSGTTGYGTAGQTIISAGSGGATAWGVLGAVGGGTGQSSYAVGDLLYASSTTALSKLSDVATGNALISGGVGAAPSWGKIGLTTHVSGTLPVANGGTGLSSLTANYIPFGNGTNPFNNGNNLMYDGTTFAVNTGGNYNVYDQIASARSSLIAGSSSSTTIAGSTANLVIGNSNTTTNNTAQLSFATLTGASTNWYSAATINAIFGARTNGQYPAGQLAFSLSKTLNSAPVEIMRLVSTGLGIGTTTPGSYSGQLVVYGGDASGWGINATTNGTYGVLLGVRSSTASIGTIGANTLSLNPDGGNVGVGTTSAGATLTLKSNGTGLGNSQWTTSTRPASPLTGQQGFNTTTGLGEIYNGSAWISFGNGSPSSISYLIVAGGGGGGYHNAGAGGAGGLLASSQAVSAGTTYTVTVGAGGAAGNSGTPVGTTGSNSSFTPVSTTALGGGGGGSLSGSYNGVSGGSGGGGASDGTSVGSGGSGTSGQGNNGAPGVTGGTGPGGGGGGAGGAGSTGSGSGGGAGGIGISSSISGSATYYAGGGGGGNNTGTPGAGGNGGGGNGGINGGPNATNGGANTGGGGGGGQGTATAGGAGGSGVVIIAYPSFYKLATATGTYAQTSSGGNYVFTFTGSGTITF